MSIRSSLRNAKYECRHIMYGGLGPLVQKLYTSGFNNYDGGTLEPFLGEESQLPDLAATAGFLWASYRAGKAIDGKWPKLLRGSVQTLTYAALIAGTIAAGASIESNSNMVQSVDYIDTVKQNVETIMREYMANGQTAPLMYTVLYGGFVTGAARWAKNIGSALVQLGAGKPGPTQDYNKPEDKK